jgi:hypothetical protein
MIVTLVAGSNHLPNYASPHMLPGNMDNAIAMAFFFTGIVGGFMAGISRRS